MGSCEVHFASIFFQAKVADFDDDVVTNISCLSLMLKVQRGRVP